ncbi:MAG: cobalamin-dependent protein [Syntrophobacteraceae bacterium]|jgi:methylmalonyl-CoA mutase C-terminal domain/subunit|nr:cobalamin-dependent protein [Syntrophobacteraceae bacterium]
MAERRVRILMAKFGEGYEMAIMKLARAFSEAGFEVIYTELRDPQAIVNSAIQESVDHIGVTTLPGAHIESFSTLIGLLQKEGAGHIRITAGGFLDDASIPRVKAMGVVEFFPKGTTYEELIDWAGRNIKATEE